MDSPTCRTQKTTTLVLYFSRQWPWLHWGICTLPAPPASFDFGNPGICIHYSRLVRSRPASTSPSDPPSISFEEPTRLGEIWSGQDVPDGMHILHSCDNPRCCNPEHLRIGTHQDNMNDKVSRGRSGLGAPRKGKRLNVVSIQNEA